MLQEHIASKWSSTTGIKIHCVTSKACLSAGDALRELDSLGLIRTDPFVLISGDVISNINLSKVIDFHRERRKEDSNAIMTVVLKEIQSSSGIESVRYLHLFILHCRLTVKL